MKVGKKNLITDVTGVMVGNSHNEIIKSGVTVFTSDKRFAAAVTVLGGAPGTRETDLLEFIKKDNITEKYINNTKINKVIYVQNRLINILIND